MSLKYRNNAMFRSKRSRGAMTLFGDQPTLRQRLLWITLTAIVPYCWIRVKRVMQQLGWSQQKYEEDFPDGETSAYRLHVWKNRLYNVCKALESIYQIARFVNFIFFLRVGEFRSLVDRMLQMRLVYSRDASSRALSFEYLNRDLLLNSVQDFALFLMPIINVGPALRSVSRGARQFFASVGHVTGIRKRKKRRGHVRTNKKALTVEKRVRFAENTGSSTDEGGHIEIAANMDLTCRRCNANPACMPYAMPCGCVFCYFCLRTGLHERKGADGQEMLYCLNCDAKFDLLLTENVDATHDSEWPEVGAAETEIGSEFDSGIIAKRI